MLALEALHRAGVHMTEQELDRLLLRVISAMAPAPLARDPRRDLTEADAAALELGGFSLQPLDDVGPGDPLVQTAALYASLMASSLSVTETARLLGVSTGRVRQELAAGTLYGIKDVGGWRLPRWQFNDEGTGLLPGVRRVLPYLSRNVHPVGVYTWFTSPDPDLTIDEQEDVALSPRDWLRGGRSPEVVAELATSLGIMP